MNHALKRIVERVAITGAAALLLSVVADAAGARVNTTNSIPVGLYWVTSAPIEKGAYVFFCPPQIGIFAEAKERGYIGAGFCPGGYGYMMKRVLAAKSDVVTVADDGVRVNGEMLPFSVPIKADKAGRPLPRYQSNAYTLGESELLLMSDVSPISFDSRYFGPVSRSQIKAVIRPVVTW